MALVSNPIPCGRQKINGHWASCNNILAEGAKKTTNVRKRGDKPLTEAPYAENHTYVYIYIYIYKRIIS
jgi:hypothetical protein